MGGKMKKVLCFAILLLPLFLLAQNLLNNPESIAYDAENDRYLVSNCGDGKVIAIDAEGNHSDFFTGLGVCLGNLIFEGVLYVSCQEYDGVSSGKAVVGIDLETQQLVMTVEFASNNTVDGLAINPNGMLYVIDTTGRIFQIDVYDHTLELVLTGGLGLSPQDCFFDYINNRLIVVNFNGNNSYVSAVDPVDFSTSILLNPDFGSFDGVTMDQYGNVYLASYENGGCLYRVDDSFAYEPELISSGYTGPAGIDYNTYENIVAVPNFYTHIVNFVDIEFDVVAEFSASVIMGSAPLEVQFYDETLGGPIVWWWDFNADGGTDSFEQDPVWTFTEPGIYTVELKVHNGEFEDTEIKTNYIFVEETDAEETLILPELILEQNYPNPFNPVTEIRCQVIDGSIQELELEIYNIKGQKVKKLRFNCHPEFIEGSFYNDNASSSSSFDFAQDDKLRMTQAGSRFSITWNGTDDHGNPVPSGTYIYQLRSGDQILGSRKCMLLK
jgi:PKD repeat protein